MPVVDHLQTEPAAETHAVATRRLSARDAAISCALYVGVFAALAWPWLDAASYAVPLSHIVHQADERVVAWILAWVSRALVTAPQHLMDANINYPAPGQLAGIEHFLSAQLLFAPAYWATGNAVLSANITVLLTYPLGALAMECLLVALGCRRSVAWVGGLAFALGPFRVPGNLMTLKYVNLHLALVGLALTRLREHPRLRAAFVLSVAMTLALLSSYYLAVMVSVMGAVWAALELLRREPGRARFTALGLAASGASLVPFLLVSLPYLRHSDSAGMGIRTSGLNWAVNTLGWEAQLSGSWVVVALAVVGIAFVWSSGPAARRVARLGAPIALVAGLLMLGPVAHVGSLKLSLPFQLLAHTPLRFFQAPSRFAVVFGLGATLLAVATLEGIRHRFGRRAGNLAAVAVAAAVLATVGIRLPGAELDRIEAQTHPIYAAVADTTAREGGGPLLDLPRISLVEALKSPVLRFGSEAEAMLGSTRHWLPLVTGMTSHPPPHRQHLNDSIARLPADNALDDIVDMSHVRWLLLRPPVQWPVGQKAKRSALLASPRLERVLHLSGWDLLRVVGAPRHPEWFAAIAAGARADHTPLGTPLATIPESAARAQVTAESRVSTVAYAGQIFPLGLRVRNAGSAAWPVMLARLGPPTHSVRLSARWVPADREPGQDGVLASREIELRRDVAPGEEIASIAYVPAPDRVGPHDLEIHVVQVAGARFDGPGNAPFRARIMVVSPPSGP